MTGAMFAIDLGAARQWRVLGLAALLTSGVAWASLPGRAPLSDDERQWQALGVQPLAAGGRTGLRMAPAAVAEPVAFVTERESPFAVAKPKAVESVQPSGPLRITGRAGDGLYWALRSAGATPDAAAQYLAALAGEIDVGADSTPASRFYFTRRGAPPPRVLYAGLDRGHADDLQLVRWSEGWVDAAREDAPEPVETGLILPAAGRITSYFGTRIHPILRFARFHAGVDIGAGWGAPIVAAGDGQVVGAGWAGGYGRQIRIAHGGGTVSTYSHMSDYAVAPGTFVRRGQVIGYVGSSGFSTGPHLHFEVRQGGVAVNPLGVTLLSAPTVDPELQKKAKARLAMLMKAVSRRA
jgi:murein DD-endopeptidase MepM/ murein hydrolase activator NlpD